LSARSGRIKGEEDVLAKLQSEWPPAFFEERRLIFEMLASTQARLQVARNFHDAAMARILEAARDYGRDIQSREEHTERARAYSGSALAAGREAIGSQTEDDFRHMAGIFKLVGNCTPPLVDALEELRKLARHICDGEALRRKLIKRLSETQKFAPNDMTPLCPSKNQN